MSPVYPRCRRIRNGRPPMRRSLSEAPTIATLRGRKSRSRSGTSLTRQVPLEVGDEPAAVDDLEHGGRKGLRGQHGATSDGGQAAGGEIDLEFVALLHGRGDPRTGNAPGGGGRRGGGGGGGGGGRR